jgi:hypothetical protein
LFTLRQKTLLHAFLGMVLLLVGGANLFTVAVDDDGDEDTPPVVVQLNLVANRRTSVVSRDHVQRRVNERKCAESTEHMVTSLDRQPVIGPGNGSSELIVPLRT